jgi:hypothetical protein
MANDEQPLRQICEEREYTDKATHILGARNEECIREAIDCILSNAVNMNEIAFEIGRKDGRVLYGIRTDATKAFPSIVIYFSVEPCSDGERVILRDAKLSEPLD